VPPPPNSEFVPSDCGDTPPEKTCMPNQISKPNVINPNNQIQNIAYSKVI